MDMVSKLKKQSKSKGLIKQTSGGTGFQPVKEFRIYRRNLPHWEQPGNFYFITFRTTQNIILPIEARNIVVNGIKFYDGKDYKLYAYVIMPDHIHLVIRPLEKARYTFYSIAEIMHNIKSYSGKEIIKLFKNTGKMPVLPNISKMPAPPKIWLDESFDRIIKDENELFEKTNYIVNNPIRKDLARNPKDYKWLYVKGWLDDKSQAGMHVPPLCKKQVTGRSDIPV
jgi:REP element-mobilizing transposase RayT